MITLCCSLKVRKRLGLPDKLPPPKSASTVLGNWYVSLQHFGKLQMILATSEASLLSVVFPARDLRLTLERNLQAGLGRVLLALGVSPNLSLANSRKWKKWPMRRPPIAASSVR